MNVELQHVPHNHLAERCAEESTRREAQQRDDRFCFELIRRAFGLEDHDALGYVFQIYISVWSWFWIRNVAAFETHALTADDFKSIAFQKVYRQLKGGSFNSFSTLNAILAYLRTTLVRTIAEYYRSLEAQYAQKSDDIDMQEAEEYIADDENVSEQTEKKLAWEAIEQRIAFLLPDQADRILFICWAKQQRSRSEIVSEFGMYWEDEDAVRVALQRIRRHLYKDPSLRILLEALK